VNALPPTIDKDSHRIADEWEAAHPLNSSDANDALAFTRSKDYTNLEVYLNDLLTHKKGL
jgi:hypothetical protein